MKFLCSSCVPVNMEWSWVFSDCSVVDAAGWICTFSFAPKKPAIPFFLRLTVRGRDAESERLSIALSDSSCFRNSCMNWHKCASLSANRCGCVYLFLVCKFIVFIRHLIQHGIDMQIKRTIIGYILLIHPTAVSPCVLSIVICLWTALTSCCKFLIPSISFLISCTRLRS